MNLHLPPLVLPIHLHPSFLNLIHCDNFLFSLHFGFGTETGAGLGATASTPAGGAVAPVYTHVFLAHLQPFFLMRWHNLSFFCLAQRLCFADIVGAAVGGAVGPVWTHVFVPRAHSQPLCFMRRHNFIFFCLVQRLCSADIVGAAVGAATHICATFFHMQ